MTTARVGLRRLRAAAAAGRLDNLCREHDVTLLLVFGSVLDPRVPTPRDLDVAVRFVTYTPARVLPLLDALAELAGTSDVDLMVLNLAGPVAREEALVYGEALFASAPTVHAEAQIAATMERMDTDHLRRTELALLVRGPQ